MSQAMRHTVVTLLLLGHSSSTTETGKHLWGERRRKQLSFSSAQRTEQREKHPEKNQTVDRPASGGPAPHAPGSRPARPRAPCARSAGTSPGPEPVRAPGQQPSLSRRLCKRSAGSTRLGCWSLRVRPVPGVGQGSGLRPRGARCSLYGSGLPRPPGSPPGCI